jgi:hypothetical protein
LGVEYGNDLFVGDINNGNLYRFKVNAARNGFDFTSPGLLDLVADSNAEFQEDLLGTGFGGITDVKMGPDGLLYILSSGFGKIFVISSQSTPDDFDGDSTPRWALVCASVFRRRDDIDQMGRAGPGRTGTGGL